MEWVETLLWANENIPLIFLKQNGRGNYRIRFFCLRSTDFNLRSRFLEPDLACYKQSHCPNNAHRKKEHEGNDKSLDTCHA